MRKEVYTHDGSQWNLTLDRRFVWYNWLLLEELDVDASGAVTGVAKKYTWSLDLAGQWGGQTSSLSSLEGAGGIGGLLAVYDVDDPNDPNDPSGSYVYFYDANGNVGQLIDLFDGSIDAEYEYDPYSGNLLAPDDPNESGPYAAENPFRFSTKYFDAETALGYWGYRYYSPRLGRWASRDRIGERGAINVYTYSRNPPSNIVDPEGRQSWTTPYRYAMSCDAIGRKALRLDAEARKRKDAEHLQYLRNAEWQFKLAADARAQAALLVELMADMSPGKDDYLAWQIDRWEEKAEQHRKWALEWLDKAHDVYGKRPQSSVFAALEAGFLVGYGRISVSCTDECRCQHTMSFEKYCIGGIAGASVSVGPIRGLNGKDCRPDRYSGWFFENAATVFGVTVGVDVGLAGPPDNPWNIGEEDTFSGVVEGGVVPGFGAKVKVGTFCWYRYVGGY